MRLLAVLALCALSFAACGPCRIYCVCGQSDPGNSCSACNACTDAGE